MATVHRNQRGSSANLEANGWSIEEIVKVENPSGSGLSKIVNAANDPALPKIGQSFPTVPTVTLRRISVVGESSNVVELRLSWEDIRKDNNGGGKDDPSQASIEYSSGLRSVETNKDANGNLMTVTLKNANDPSADTLGIQSGTVNIDIPVRGIRMRLKTTTNPSARQATYVGKVNTAGGFRLSPASPARTWRCDAITATSSDGGKTYDEERVFSHAGYDGEGNEQRWDVTVKYLDPETGRLPEIVSGNPVDYKANAVKTFPVYDEINFNPLLP